MTDIKVCQWLDSNLGPLASEATALPTESQPLPAVDVLWMLVFVVAFFQDILSSTRHHMNKVSLRKVNACSMPALFSNFGIWVEFHRRSKFGRIGHQVGVVSHLLSWYLVALLDRGQVVATSGGQSYKHRSAATMWQNFASLVTQVRSLRPTTVWSFLVGDEQLSIPNSQTCTYQIIPCMCSIIFWGSTNTTTFCCGRYSLNLLLLKSSIHYLGSSYLD